MTLPGAEVRPFDRKAFADAAVPLEWLQFNFGAQHVFGGRYAPPCRKVAPFPHPFTVRGAYRMYE
ncbi:hypothetical protein [Halorhabdus rudnickae]|uniref:hypothetical protein n=1 Tax=Halorhabdus rudnickae TaxID=1775544 RepID=UPI001083A09C|nr:hypothetical protein [Halorhabdus rudnickae]